MLYKIYSMGVVAAIMLILALIVLIVDFAKFFIKETKDLRPSKKKNYKNSCIVLFLAVAIVGLGLAEIFIKILVTFATIETIGKVAFYGLFLIACMSCGLIMITLGRNEEDE